MKTRRGPLEILFSNPSNWTKGIMRDNSNGRSCFCLAGAMHYIYGPPENYAQAVRVALRKFFPGEDPCSPLSGLTYRITWWNDGARTTYARLQVKARKVDAVLKAARVKPLKNWRQLIK